jgi:hypothetical protein
MKVINEEEKQETLIVHDQHELTVPPKSTHKQVEMNILVCDITSNYLKDNGDSNLGGV